MHYNTFLEYEIRASWWAKHLGWRWARRVAAWYFTWKTKRKWDRYVESLLDKAMAELRDYLKEN